MHAREMNAYLVPDLPVPRPHDILSKLNQGAGYQQLLRRASVLAATRRRISGEGYDKVTLRMVAADCGITVQTVFNLVGNRTRVISDAISDHGLALHRAALNCRAYPFQILALVDFVWRSTSLDEEYMRQAALAHDSLDRGSHLTVRPANVSVVSNALSDLNGKLRIGRDRTLLVHALTSMVPTTVYDWARERTDLLTLRQQLISRSSLILLGTLQANEGEKLHEWLDDFLKNTCTL